MTSGKPGGGSGAGRSPLRRKGRLVAIILLLLAVVAGLLALRSYFADDLEHQAIRYERARRASYFASGQSLPGTPDLKQLTGRLAAHGVALGAPIFMRIFKREFELELWMQRDGRFHRFATYPICRWSGRLGPKLKTGDAQAPEGFYTVDARALNPKSRWHRSFNLGFPNAFDRQHGRTGSFLMVHGGCSSVGCYAMTNAVIDEIWTIVTAALDRGQKRFQVQVFPFRMTEGSLDGRADGTLLDYWRSLKAGHDLFERDYLPPKVSVCGGKYVVGPAGAVTDGSAPIEVTCRASS